MARDILEDIKSGEFMFSNEKIKPYSSAEFNRFLQSAEIYPLPTPFCYRVQDRVVKFQHDESANEYYPLQMVIEAENKP